jgi:Dolichyl-phosphate-mannose-protein mannosyltransferase
MDSDYHEKLPARIASLLWLAWIPVLASTTAALCIWHLEYFRSPGPPFHRIALVFLPGLAVSAWIYSAVRKKGVWRYEPAALAILVAAALLRYEPLAALVVAALFVSCSALGKAAFRGLGLTLEGPVERIAAGFAAGCGLMISGLFVLGLTGLFYRSIFVGMLVLPPAIFWKETRDIFFDVRALNLRWRDSKDLTHPLAGVAIVFGFVATICTLMVMLVPSIILDAVSLHLPSVEYYAWQNALKPVPEIDYSYFPQGIETLWTLAYALAGQAAAQMISALFFLIFLMVLFRLARECGLDHAASVIGVICAGTMPFLHWSGSVMKNDLALALFEVSALYAFVRWLRSRSFGWILAGTFFIAQALGVKYVALFGTVPLIVLYCYAVWRQPRRWRAAAIVAAVLIVFGGAWPARAYLLTGNPVAPEKVRSAGTRLGVRQPTVTPTFLQYAKFPWQLTFDDLGSFESPLKSPAGILVFAFAPLLVISGRLRPRTGAQWAGVLFTSMYLCYWAFILLKLRYAIAPFALLALLLAGRMKTFYDSQPGRIVRVSLIAVETYALLIAVMGVMIIEVNAPQFAYFAGRIDKPDYLRAAMRTYGSVEYLKHSAGADASVYSVGNFSRAYAPDPWRFGAMWCQPESCGAAKIASRVQNSHAQYAILPENPALLPEVLDRLGHPERLYRDPYFSVYRVE